MHLTNLIVATAALAPFAAAHYGLPIPKGHMKRASNRGCANVTPPPSIYKQIAKSAQDDDSFSRASDGSSDCTRTITVDTYLHAALPAKASTSYMSETQMKKQIDVMNAAYAPYDIVFNLKGITRTLSNNITEFSYEGYSGIEGSTPAIEKYWKETRVGDYKTLHVWFYQETPGGLLGVCNFPDADRTEDEYYLDGCHVHGDTLPGGALENYNLGMTAVHEIGHWFGLFHVFQDQDCTSDGDLIADTPAQSIATDGCPVGQDSCPKQKGLDSIHNYMDYSYDSCYEEFTAGQENRMHQLFTNIRAAKS